MSAGVSAKTLKGLLRGDKELALIDVRENGTFGDGHMLFACNIPLSRLELRFGDLVPRLGTPVVVCDGGDGLARQAAQRLESFGYRDVRILDGGLPAWKAAGFEVFSGVNVPSKAFGEFVEHEAGTPSLSPQELKALVDGGRKLVILDSRPWEEYHAMNIPGGIDVPGAELVYRVADVAPDPDTLVVVNCAGRTRSIIGAQSLINAGIPNEVIALRNGTMGWHLAGLTLERGQIRKAPPVSAQGLAKAKAAADQVGRRFGVRTVDTATVDQWRKEAETRTLYLLDVRTPEEFEAGHLPGSRHAPGGQLVQATDTYVVTRGARVVLIDNDGVRATLTASWLIQLGWDDVYVLKDGLKGAALAQGPHAAKALGPTADLPEVTPHELNGALQRKEAVLVDLATSLQYKAAHIPGAWWGTRARMGQWLAKVPNAPLLVFASPDGTLAKLAARDAQVLSGKSVAVLRGGTQAWKAQGLPVTTGPEHLADTPDDAWLRPYDREQGVEAAMKEYLSWEVDLVEQIKRDGDARFRFFPEN
ncbi:MAG TPA: rhodanese-like domain-containing protein [bacterium]